MIKLNRENESHKEDRKNPGGPQVWEGHPHRYPILFVILIGILMFVVDAVVVSIALPTMTTYFHASVALTQWIITAYLVSITSLLLICGRISEYTGRSRMFLVGIILFTISSLGCGISSSLSMLILFRILQAAGGAMAFSISAALIFQTFPKGELGRAMGYIGSTIAVGSIAGPVLGGYVVDLLGWQYIFLINVPIGITLLLLAMRYLKIDEIRRERLEMDWIGAGTMIFFMVALMLFMGELASHISLGLRTAAYALMFFGGFSAFIANERIHRRPLLDL
ncbi:MAG: MFS transporter, partial [Methanothrix sp.]|nr:MFS transporter [Methanothrix sp.]